MFINEFLKLILKTNEMLLLYIILNITFYQMKTTKSKKKLSGFSHFLTQKLYNPTKLPNDQVYMIFAQGKEKEVFNAIRGQQKSKGEIG